MCICAFVFVYLWASILWYFPWLFGSLHPHQAPPGTSWSPGWVSPHYPDHYDPWWSTIKIFNNTSIQALSCVRPYPGEFFHRGRRLEAGVFWYCLCIFVLIRLHVSAFVYFWICFIVVFCFKREDWNQSPLEWESMLDIRKQQSWLPHCAMEGIFIAPPNLEPGWLFCVFVPLLLNSLLDILKKGNWKQTKLARLHLQWKELSCWCENQNCPWLFHLWMCLCICSGVSVFLHVRKTS